FALLPEVTPDIIRYKLYIEFNKPPDDLEAFTAFIDERLGLANMTYAAQRQANVLSLPVIIPVKPGGFEIMLQHREKVLGQTKVPRLLTQEISRMIPILNHGS
ncbi:MAG: GH3 auxin-responsive promoter family protein, partial [Promethearchaeota archaeon]